MRENREQVLTKYGKTLVLISARNFCLIYRRSSFLYKFLTARGPWRTAFVRTQGSFMSFHRRWFFHGFFGGARILLTALFSARVDTDPRPCFRATLTTHAFCWRYSNCVRDSSRVFLTGLRNGLSFGSRAPSSRVLYMVGKSLRLALPTHGFRAQSVSKSWSHFQTTV